jgi:hypothetical protein
MLTSDLNKKQVLRGLVENEREWSWANGDYKGANKCTRHYARELIVVILESFNF